MNFPAAAVTSSHTHTHISVIADEFMKVLNKFKLVSFSTARVNLLRSCCVEFCRVEPRGSDIKPHITTAASDWRKVS